MKIKIDKPLDLRMSLLESEDRLPSIKMLIEVNIVHPTGTASYTAEDIWFDCTQWDKFVNELSKLYTGIDEMALLKSLSEYFEIRVSKAKNVFLFELICKEPDTGNGILECKYYKNIESEELGIIKEKFGEFPKWW